MNYIELVKNGKLDDSDRERYGFLVDKNDINKYVEVYFKWDKLFDSIRLHHEPAHYGIDPYDCSPEEEWITFTWDWQMIDYIVYYDEFNEEKIELNDEEKQELFKVIDKEYYYLKHSIEASLETEYFEGEW